MTKRAYFGTDGIRGPANTLSDDRRSRPARRPGRRQGVPSSSDDRRHLVVIGKDTRLSGYMIEPALVAGFASVGMDVRLFGPLPTPAVAMMTRSMRADLGVMISASHNALRRQRHQAVRPRRLQALRREGAGDRGADGRGPAGGPGRAARPWPRRRGSTTPRPATSRSSRRPSRASSQPVGLRVVDRLRQRRRLQGRPDGALRAGRRGDPRRRRARRLQHQRTSAARPTRQAMAEAVKEYRADIGIALDGDADRLVICDEKGQIVDGDQIMAHHRRRTGPSSERLHGRRRGRHGHVQPGPGALPAGARS